MENGSIALTSLAALQGVFYVLTGVWPVLHIKSFERVTGPKTDRWLVRTVGLLITVIGAALIAVAVRGTPSLEAYMLGIGATLALAAVDVFYVSVRVIPKVYLLDAVVEVGLAVAWVLLVITHEL